MTKKRFKTLLAAALTAIWTCAAAWRPAHTDQTLWYDIPARQWEETVPLGNGRMGMMPDGGIRQEKIVLNEISMWSGTEADYSNPEASKCLPQIQRLLAEGKNKEAQDLMYEHFVPSRTDGNTYGTYQMLADLDITYNLPRGLAADYHRWLDLSDASAWTSFTIDHTTYTRRYTAPRGKDLMIVHISADNPGMISFTLTLNRKERGETETSGHDRLNIRGTLDSGSDDTAGVSFEASVRIIPVGERARLEAGEKDLTLTGADEAWIAIAATTSYWARVNPEFNASLGDPLEGITAGDLADDIREGTAAYRALYGRAGVSFPATAQSALPTDKRIEAFAGGDDPEMAALYYNYGRYLLISSTLPGFLPPNLQGLWANECVTPWNGDYHTNINVQMNHWPAEPGNLSELHLPLVDLVERSVPSGERTARAFYGDDARGWVMHMMTNPWNYTEPGEHPSWGATNTGGAWLCAHLWEHHLYNPSDTAYLRRIYPIMKGASEFFLSTMIEEPSHGWLVTAPSSSPENEFIIDGEKVSVCMGPTMDTQLVTELYTNVIGAASALGVDSAYTDSLKTALAKLPPMQTGKDGRLMEWLEEYTEADPHHRHVSHLYGLHPGNQISPYRTPALAEASRLTLETRGDGGTGWSRAWKINFWARLGDGNRAYRLFKGLLEPAYTDARPHHDAGTFPNLFCSHPPFQMDGNWGGTSGISEMLVQSHDGFINLLPALPDALADGSLHGFLTRGGGTVNMEWADGRPTYVEIYSPTATTVKLPTTTAAVTLNGSPAAIHGGFLSIPTGKSVIAASAP